MKNDHLGFEIPYTHKGSSHRYVPDFLARLVPEPATTSSAPSSSRCRAGRRARARPRQRPRPPATHWCTAVNNDGRFGRWGYIEIDSMLNVDARLDVAIDALYADAPIIGEPAASIKRRTRTMPPRSRKPAGPTPVGPSPTATSAPTSRQPTPTTSAAGPPGARDRRYPRDLRSTACWCGRARSELDEHDLETDAPPIYIQEKIDPRVLVENLRQTAKAGEDEPELTLFETFDGLDGLDLVEFYEHEANWSNRMILGDSLQVMASLDSRERLRGKVQMIYVDPPYGIKFGSNWQVSARKRDVKDGKVEDIAREVEQIKAFRDTWELGINSYLTYLRDRLLVARELLTESGTSSSRSPTRTSISFGSARRVFGGENFVAMIVWKKASR